MAPQHARGIAAQHAQAQHADPGRRRRLGQAQLPARLALVAGEQVLHPVVFQHVQQHVLAHRPGERRIDQPAQRQVPGQGRIVQHGIDPGPQRQDRLQVRQGSQQARRRQPDQRQLDLGRVAEIRVNPHLQAGHLAGELGAPKVRVIRSTHEQQSQSASPPV
jgi:hypothetical protein